ncbi:NUDIX domain-containing protein [Aurantibacter crassamenti]|uniref:NUDIX hydrolase n=1 Tax=Aurantibacter crassamenti TaxID=1837375 RepID=UPI00193A6E11|nr:NUDIX domain-containing protein [Aurantibacter crassamenti]MBM1107544.1 NUDIX domain-containing protein [Aurantibacter crassamenti]
MDELIDILDSNGKLTGRTALKSEAHRNGLYHQTVHVWFYTSDGKILLQQRGKYKDTHPLLFDVSVAGHIGAGEQIEIAALREVQEEIGISITQNELKKIGIFKSEFKHNQDLKDNEFHHTFLCELNHSLDSLTKQESEVESLALIRISEFKKELKDPILQKKYVSHTYTYFTTIINEINALLK